MDDSFGPRLLGHFDFTLLFEHTMFHMMPSAIVIFTLPYYIHKIVTCRPVIRSGWLLWAKLTVVVAIAAVQIATVVFWYQSPLDSKIAQAAAILTLLGSIGVAALTYASHTHFLQPMLFLSVYLSITLIFDLVSVYTYLHRTGLASVARLTCALPALKFILVILEEVSKRSLIIAENRDQLTTEATAGFWSRSMFLWINPLLLFGFRHVIDSDTLPDIGQQFRSSKVFHEFKTHWDKRDKKAKHALFKAVIFTMPWPFLYAILPRLSLVGFIFSQPFLLQDVVTVISGRSTQPDDISKEDEIIGLILATAFVFCGKAISRNWFSHIRNQIMISFRGILVSAIFEKSLRLTAKESEDSAALTLMGTDVDGVNRLVSLCYDTCAMVFEVGFGIEILTVFVGAASIFTVITALVVAVGSRHMAKKMVANRKIWNEHISNRVAATSNMLAQIKDIKMAGLAPSMAAHLNQLRAKEVSVSLDVRRINCITFGIGSFTDTVTPALVVAATLFWTREAQKMTPARFYTILAVISLIAQPLTNFFSSFQSWATGFACLDRVQAYLVQDEVKDTRKFIDHSAPNLTNAVTLRRRTGKAAAVSHAVQLRSIAVSMGASVPILSNATMTIKVGEVTIIHGSVGSGKSTLLRAMLGEIILKSGSSTLSSRSIAFAGQQPWLLNTTIRLNIIGRKVFNPTLYQKVIFICDLTLDFALLPDGDQSIVGSTGCNISGGQKQRISIARALYVEAETTILDDPFSALDQRTSLAIRTRLLTDGYATENGRTLVMTTNTKQHLAHADTVFRVAGGRVQYITPAEVEVELKKLTGNLQSTRSPSAKIGGKGEEQCELPPLVQAAPNGDTRDSTTTRPKSHSRWSLYVFFFRPAGILLLTTWLVLTAFAAFSERLPNVFARVWLGADAGDHRYFIGFAAVCLLHPILNCFSAMFFFFFVVEKAAIALHETLVKATFTATFEFLSNEDAASILNRFSHDISMVSTVIPASMMPTVFRAGSILIDIAIISAGATYAAPVIPFFLLHILTVQQFYLRTSKQLRIIQLDTSKTLVRLFTETAAGIEHIRAFRWQDEVLEDFYAMLDVTQRPLYFLYCIQQWLECVLDFSSAVAAVIVVTFALKFSNSASGNSMGLALLSLIAFSDTISEWVRSSVAMETALGAISRIKSYCEETPTETYQDEGPAASDWPATGQVELKNMSVSYKSTPSSQAHQIYNADVIVRPGETLGIVGRTGCGKTTLLLSMLNLLKYKGEIRIDDRDIRTIPPDLLRSRITTIAQGGIYLRGSVKFNLYPFCSTTSEQGFSVTDDMLEDVLRRVRLWDMVNSRGGLASPMKDMGFSLGQRQIFQLARAILHHEVTGSRIVLMDEVTANLDAATEERIAVILEDAFRGCTRLVISHRMSALEGADSVLVMKNGQARVVQNTPGGVNWVQEIE